MKRTVAAILAAGAIAAGNLKALDLTFYTVGENKTEVMIPKSSVQFIRTTEKSVQIITLASIIDIYPCDDGPDPDAGTIDYLGALTDAVKKVFAATEPIDDNKQHEEFGKWIDAANRVRGTKYSNQLPMLLRIRKAAMIVRESGIWCDAITYSTTRTN